MPTTAVVDIVLLIFCLLHKFHVWRHGRQFITFLVRILQKDHGCNTTSVQVNKFIACGLRFNDHCGKRSIKIVSVYVEPTFATASNVMLFKCAPLPWRNIVSSISILRLMLAVSGLTWSISISSSSSSR